MRAMKKTVLLLASDPEIRKVIVRILESKGYFVLAASEIGQAEKYVEECPIDLLMVRHYTENMSGHDAAIYLRNLSPGIPVLLVGGLPDDSELESRETLHEFEIFPKPFTAAELLDKVREVLMEHSSQARSSQSDRR
jgi:DNA-binding NtrC family response regulator